MTVAETSRLAYDSIKKLGDKQEAVRDAIAELGVANNKQIAQHLGWEINRITGRVNELVRMGYVTLERIDVSSEGRKVKFWSVSEPQEVKPARAVSWLYDNEDCGA